MPLSLEQAAVFRDGVGASSGAPAQDHFGFPHGPDVVPLGPVFLIKAAFEAPQGL